MSILVGIQNISKAFGVQQLFEDVAFSIESGDRIGLIGPNGAGKSTLLKIIAGLESPDRGDLSVQRGIVIGYLGQDPTFQQNSTVESAIYSSLSDEDYEGMSRAEEIMSRLDLKGPSVDPSAHVESLSGGWKKRVALARELVRQPDLLLLDEPTNHLDIESILWLEKLLSNARFATLTITHDRAFLQKVASRIIELNRKYPKGTLDTRGDYAQFLESREQFLHEQQRHETVLRNTLTREVEWLRRGAKARQTKQQARIERAGDLKAQVDELQQKNRTQQVGLDFQTGGRAPKELIVAKDISKSYAENIIFQNVDLTIRKKTRLGILGRNGAGKSTLLRILLGQEAPDTGKVTHSERLSVAYFEQNRDVVDLSKTVIENVLPLGEWVDFHGSRLHVRTYLERFLFAHYKMEMPARKLSGGERSRLALAKLMLIPSNILVLDEPTNDLDMETLDVLEQTLKEYDGAILLVSHDRYFLDQVSNQVIALPEKSGEAVLNFATYEQWEQWRLLQGERRSVDGVKRSPELVAKVLTKLSFKEQREFDEIESVIHQAEENVRALALQIEEPHVASHATELARLCDELEKEQKRVEALYRRWSELEERIKIK